MKKNKYIPDIHHYCDNWCEKCAFTSQCEYFQQNQQNFQDESTDNIDDSLLALDVVHTDKSLHNATNAAHAKTRREQAATHNCTIAAKKYIDVVDDFLNKYNERIEKTLSLEQENTYQKNKILTEKLEIIKWYQPQVYVKISRALYAQMIEQEQSQIINIQIDSNGSAKVALLAIERSLKAWNLLLEKMPVCEDEILQILVLLKKLSKSIEHQFPLAWQFKRPGFDSNPYPTC